MCWKWNGARRVEEDEEGERKKKMVIIFRDEVAEEMEKYKVFFLFLCWAQRN